MTTLNTEAVDRATYIITASFTDEESTTVVPNSVVWTLTDRNGNVINSRSAVSETPASTVTIVLSGDDLAWSDGPKRILTIEATYDSTNGTSLPLNEEVRFDVENLVNI